MPRATEQGASARMVVSLEHMRDRVIGLERHHGYEIADCPYQWKIHPEGQLEPLAAFIKTIGFAGAILCYWHDGVLTAADGHGRKSLQPDFLYPCLMTDLTPDEVKHFIALYDEFAHLRVADKAKMQNLLAEVAWDDPILTQFIDEFSFTVDSLSPPSHESQARTIQRSPVMIKAVLMVADAALIERALRQTGEPQRGKALTMICEAYLDTKG